MVSPATLAWAFMALACMAVLAALGIVIQGVAASGDYGQALSHQSVLPFITLVFAIVGALVASRHPHNPIGWIFVAEGLLYALLALAAAVYVFAPSSAPVHRWAAWFGNWLWIPGVMLPATFVLLIFPDGHLPSPRWRLIAWSAALGLAMIVLAVMFHPGPLPGWGVPANSFGLPGAAPILDRLLDAGSLLLVIGLFGSLAAFVVRLRRSAGIQRAQLKWLAYAVGVIVFSFILGTVGATLWPASPVATEISIVFSNLSILGFACATAIAILRHRLYDIDLIINRTLVYTALTVALAASYGLVVGALGILFQGAGNLLVSLIATGLAAVLFQPLRAWLQHAANRLMYGDRDDPYAVLSHLSRRLESSLSPETTLPTVVETIALALRLPYVAIALKQEDDFKIAASYGAAAHEPVELPLLYQGETVGTLRLSTRSPQETFTPAEQRLLEDIARHVGVNARAALLTQDLRRLADDLQRSREELVKGREEERRRLRRDLHDQLGPQLASLKLNLEVARRQVSRDPAAAEALLAELRGQTQSAIADIRRLVFDLRPPALDELGLTGAIQEYARHIVSDDGLQIHFDSPDDLQPLPAAVEVAAYRITLEALANIVRHSHARNGRITLATVDRHLQVEVCDDGLGLPGSPQPGVGLHSMRERAEELGGTFVMEALPRGGTRVLARLPLA